MPPVPKRTVPLLRLRANSADPLEGVGTDGVLRDLRAAATGRTASIVGMWKTTLLSMGNTNRNPSIPDGAQLDFSYSQWHSDGTELYNAGSRPQVTAQRVTFDTTP